MPVSISDAADVEFISGTQVHLTDGFHAGTFTGNGKFRAYLDGVLGSEADMVVVAPDPATHIVGNMLHVNKWEKLEIGLRLPQEYLDAIDSFFDHYYPNAPQDLTASPGNVDDLHDLNPYADDSLIMFMKLIDPDGQQRMKWGFFMREADWASTDPLAELTEDMNDPLHPYNVRYRMAPDKEGLWQFELTVEAPHTSTPQNIPLLPYYVTNYSFICEPPLPDTHGYLEVNTTNRRTLKFEDGTPFFGLGVNMADKNSGTKGEVFYRRDFDVMRKSMEELQSVGGNFMRMFLLRSLFAPEWVNLGVYDNYRAPACFLEPDYEYLGNCQFQCWAFDQMLDHARENNIYVQLCIDPYPPILTYENTLWQAHPYYQHFLDTDRDGNGRFNMTRFFYEDGDPTKKDDGSVFYYWKRKYKYIMSRWGYSVNVVAIEPFNETDQMIQYRDNDLSDDDAICAPNRMNWPKDDDLPVIIDHWVTDIAKFVRDDVDLADPVGSPLGESNKLFLMSYTDVIPPLDGNNSPNTDHYRPFLNDEVDLIDVHQGLYGGEDAIESSRNEGEVIRNNYLSNGMKKPFHRGEHNYYQRIDQNPDPNIENYYDTEKVFHNYDVSFHNELWASTFFGSWAAASTWHWDRVFWWPDALPHGSPQIPYDSFNMDQPVHSGILGDTNYLKVGPQPSVPVVNRTTYHHFQSLHDYLHNANWLGIHFFDQEYTPKYYYDAQQGIECYYLQSDDGLTAIGWVHNVNAYWNNNYYLKSDNQNFFGCFAPTTQQLTLPGFQGGLNYHVSWFPTRLDTIVLPNNQVDSTQTGSVLLDLSSAPLGDTIQYFLDTLRADHAFIIAQQFIPKNLIGSIELNEERSGWDISVFPNPARNEVNVLLPDDDEQRDVMIYDLAGKRIRSINSQGRRLLNISIADLAKGTYCVRVSDSRMARVKTLVIH